LLGWFAVEMGFIGAMVAEGVQSAVGTDIGRAPGIVAASLLICAVSVVGISLISRAPLLFLPLLTALLLAVMFLTFQASGGGQAAVQIADKSLGTGVSAIVGAYIVGCLIMPDYSRFVRTSKAAVGATIIALGPVFGLVLGTYALAGLVTQNGQPSAILAALGLPAIVGLLLPVGLMQNGIMCLYSSSLATSTLLKSVSFRPIAIITMLVGMVMALAGADGFFVNFLVILGIIFPPAAALLIDAGLFRQSEQENIAWQWPSLAVWCFGIACGCGSAWFGLGVTGFPAFDGFLGAAAGAAASHMIRFGK
jgi:cytosine permease